MTKHTFRVVTMSAGADNHDDLLWVDKHRPKTKDQIVGNQLFVKQIESWLRKWHKDQEIKALLIAGPPGTGKTTAATLIAESFNLTVTSFNASDVRNKKAIKDVVAEAAYHQTPKSFFAFTKTKPYNSIIVLDEVDGLAGSEDRGGMQEIVQIVKTTRNPIICIANDVGDPKMKTLKNNTDVILWKSPPPSVIAPHVVNVCKLEGLTINKLVAEKLAEFTHGDIRQMLNFLQMWSQTSNTISMSEVRKQMEHAAGKDFDQGMFDAATDLFKSVSASTQPDWIDQRINRYFVDSHIMPLFVADNYLRAKPHVLSELTSEANKSDVEKFGSKPVKDMLEMEAVSDAADAVSQGDVMSDLIYRDQNFGLMESHAFMSCVYPSWIVRGGMTERIGFPAVLGKMSTARKNTRISSEVGFAISTRIPASVKDMNTSVLSHVRQHFINLLRSAPSGEDAKAKVVRLILEIEHFGMDKEDFDNLMEWGETFIRNQDDTFKKLVSTSEKSAITRSWNAGSHTRKFSRTASMSSNATRTARVHQEDDEEAERNDEEADDGSELDAEESKPKQKQKTKATTATAKEKPKVKTTTKATKGKSKRKAIDLDDDSC